MIIDVPTGNDFKSSGIDYLNLAWGTLINLLRELKEAQSYFDEHSGYEREEVASFLSPEKYWGKAQRPLSTALSLVQQGTEFLLKGDIALVSPYLLISGDPSSYPSKSQERNVRFSEFKTIDSKDLIRAFNTVSANRLPDSFQQRFENLRSRRNTIMHTVDPDLHINVKDLFVEILEICHYLLAPESWINIRRNFIEKEARSALLEPEEYRQYDHNIYQLAFEIDLVVDLLQPSRIRKYFRFEKKHRRYICPVCYSKTFQEVYANVGLEHDIPRLANLVPNEPASNSVYCIVCNKFSEVVRENCENVDCPGNVFGHGICLTCGSY